MTPQEQARAELARREAARQELARRQSAQQQAPQSSFEQLITGAQGPQAIVPNTRNRVLPSDMQADVNRVGQFMADRAKTSKFKRLDAFNQGISSGLGGNVLGAAVGSILPVGPSRFGQFRNNLEMQRQLSDIEKSGSPKLAKAAEIGSSIAGFGKVAGAGGTALRFVPKTATGLGKFAGTTAALTADAGLIGGAQAALNDENVAQGAGQGALLGLGGKLGLDVLGKGLSTVARPIMARLKPKQAAQGILRKALEQSGQSIDDVGTQLSKAAQEGSPLAVADTALPFQRLASTVARTPSAGRTKLTDFLDARQVDQGGRISEDIAGAFKAQETGQAAIKRLTDARRAADKANFSALPDKPVNISATLEQLRKSTGGSKQAGLGQTKVERAVEEIQSKLVTGKSTRVGAHRLAEIRREIRDDVDTAFRAGKSNLATELKKISQSLKGDLDAADPAFKEANRISSEMAKVRDAVAKGQKSTQPRARLQDTLDEFQGLNPDEQAAFRVGFGDKLAGRVEGAAEGVNTARSLTGIKPRQQIAEFAQDQGKLARNLERENAMFETRRLATGGSKTADNAADILSMGGVAQSVARGDAIGTIGNILRQGGAALSGQPASVRNELAEALIATSSDDLTRSVAEAVRRGDRLSQAQLALIRGSVAAIGAQ